VAERLDLSVPILHGPGCAAEVAACLAALPARRALVVTDPGVMAAGHAEVVIRALAAAGLHVAVFDDVHENPTTLDVRACADAARSHRADLLVAVGGGSSMDAAKGCNFLVTNGGDMRDYWGVDKAPEPMLPFVAVPTTAGTGSECQRFALISDPNTHAKMACGDRKALARMAFLDPVLTLTQPPFVTACTGMDALSHAVEAAVTRRATPESTRLARDAFRLLIHALPTVMREPANLAARAAMQLGAAMAGAAIEYSMLGAAHAAANPLTAHHHLVHGQAVGLMLPGVVRFNGRDPAVATTYRELLTYAGLAAADCPSPDAVARLETLLRERLTDTALAAPLAAFGLTGDDLPRLSRDAAAQWTAQFNPRPVAAPDFEELYRHALA
jgi:alcohol dehydrogenase